MSQPGTSTMTAQRIERLLRSLVGVADLRLQWVSESLGAIHILRDSRVQPHQLIRNVVSGLQAGIGVTILPTQVRVHDNAQSLEAVPASALHVSGASANGAARAEGAEARAVGNGAASGARDAARNGNGHAVAVTPSTVRTTAAPAARPAVQVRALASDLATELLRDQRENAHSHNGLQLERIDIERRGAMLRCRTVLALSGRTYSAIAEVPDGPAAEAELAARVALDALRAGGLTEATLDGVGFITISDVNYCVTTVRAPGSKAPRAGAAPMIDSMAASATAAVLTALGTYTDARSPSRARTVSGLNAKL